MKVLWRVVIVSVALTIIFGMISSGIRQQHERFFARGLIGFSANVGEDTTAVVFNNGDGNQLAVEVYPNRVIRHSFGFRVPEEIPVPLPVK